MLACRKLFSGITIGFAEDSAYVQTALVSMLLLYLACHALSSLCLSPSPLSLSLPQVLSYQLLYIIALLWVRPFVLTALLVAEAASSIKDALVLILLFPLRATGHEEISWTILAIQVRQRQRTG